MATGRARVGLQAGCSGFTMPILIEQGGQKRKGRTIAEGHVASVTQDEHRIATSNGEISKSAAVSQCLTGEISGRNAAETDVRDLTLSLSRFSLRERCWDLWKDKLTVTTSENSARPRHLSSEWAAISPSGRPASHPLTTLLQLPRRLDVELQRLELQQQV